jgi:hypothetical protein
MLPGTRLPQFAKYSLYLAIRFLFSWANQSSQEFGISERFHWP